MIKRVFCKNFFYYAEKMSECNSVECNLVKRNSIETTYYQRNRDVILKRAKDYCRNDKERLRDNTRDKYRNLLEEEKKM